MSQASTGPDHVQPGDADAIPAPETIVVTSRRVKCDGGGGALGHPLVYLNLTRDQVVECPYCSRRYVLDHKSAGGGDH